MSDLLFKLSTSLKGVRGIFGTLTFFVAVFHIYGGFSNFKTANSTQNFWSIQHYSLLISFTSDNFMLIFIANFFYVMNIILCSFLLPISFMSHNCVLIFIANFFYVMNIILCSFLLPISFMSHNCMLIFIANFFILEISFTSHNFMLIYIGNFFYIT